MKKLFSQALIIGLVISGIYIYFEPEVIGAATASDDIDVTLSVEGEITLTKPSNVAMSPAITMTQNTSIGTGNAWNVKTNNNAGYKLTLHADNANCLRTDGVFFTDYSEATANTPETWSVSSAYEFGFSVYGTDAPTATWGTDTDCSGASSSVPSATLKYQGFKGVTTIQVATKSTATSTAGVNTVLCVGAEQAGVYAPSGSYTADITGTATTL